MFPVFMFPGEPVWNEQADAVEFEVVVGEYHGRVFVPRRALRTLIGHTPQPEDALQFVCLNQPVFERATEMRIIDRRLDDDANIHLTARDIHRTISGADRF